jgi:nitrile hydratase subunit alpha
MTTDDEALRAEVLEDLLVEKGLLDRAQIDRLIERYAHDIGPLNGARVVARAWADPAYRERLLDDATAAAAELGFAGPEGNLIAVENTDAVHNVVVCTLCSCYPWPLLGLPPRWYKDPAYRSRVVREPRAVLAEFGLELPDDVEVRVWDSSAEYRYVVVPQRPPGTDDLGEEELVGLVHRDHLIGVARPGVPDA